MPLSEMSNLTSSPVSRDKANGKTGKRKIGRREKTKDLFFCVYGVAVELLVYNGWEEVGWEEGSEMRARRVRVSGSVIDCVGLRLDE
jgi:hypothetical protein